MLKAQVAVILMSSILGTASASERSAALVNSFQVFCTLAAPNFDKLAQQAEAMHLQLLNSVEPPHQGEYFSRSRTWIVGLKTGPHNLVATEVNGPWADVQSCGVNAMDALADDVRADLIKNVRLSGPGTVTTTKDNMFRLTTWNIKTETETFSVRLTDFGPDKPNGFYLGFLHTSEKPHDR